jgi:hypothetical protein
VEWATPLSVPDLGGYEFPYSNCTLVVPVGTVELYKAATIWSQFGAIIEKGSGPPISTDKASAEGVAVRSEAGRLYVNSPAAETVYIYSFTGKLLYTAKKASGLVTFDAPSEKLLIVRGTSGWKAKLMVNY